MVRQRATIRRSFWRKIELEHEEAIAYEFEKAGIIKPHEDANDFMDPLHKEDYHEWKTGKVIEDVYLNQIREICVEETTTSIVKVKYSNFNPLNPRYRVQLL